MKFKQKLQQIIVALFGKDVAAKDLNSEQHAQVAAEYTKVFNSDLVKDFEADQEESEKAAKYAAALAVLDSKEPEAGKEDKGVEKPKETVDLAKAITSLQDENKELKDKTAKLEDNVKKLGSTLEPDKPETAKIAVVIGGRHSATHLFGVDHSLFSLEKRWNRVMVNPKMAKLDDLSPAEDETIFSAFKAEAAQYGASVAKRMQHLHDLGMHPKKEDAFTQTYTALENAGLGDQFVVYRQDQLIARIQELPNVYDIFPRRFGVQDREVMTNAFIGEASQAYQTGEAWKGSMELVPEVGYVDDAMFKTKFEGMKWLERQYIGYLNKEGSDPMKWSLIEWTILQIATKLTMEQYERRILGVYVKPVATEPGNKLHASTGVIYSLLRYVHENKLLVFDDAALATYDNTGTNMVDLVIAFYDKIMEKKENFQEGKYAMYLNANHKYWYRSQVRAKYGLQQDFTGPIDTLVPDTNLRIIWVPNMKQLKFVFVAEPGNFQCLENLPGEMLNIRFQSDMESYKSWSTWKEGVSAEFVGKKFSTPALLLANAYALQEVFMNKPATTLAIDATTCDATANFWFVTAANSGATVLTDFTGAKAGVAYILENGSETNDTTVTKENKFSEIVSTYTPTKVGDYLMVVYDETAAKFFELERCVAGTRSVNETKNPNVPGGR
jgi:hypothetical protein